MQLRLVFREPAHRLIEGVHLFDRMHHRIADDADRMRARRQRNKPDPIARADQVDGGQPAVRRVAARQQLGVVAPIVDVDPIRDPEPDRIACVVIAVGQIELALDQPGAAGGVDEPARAQFAPLAGSNAFAVPHTLHHHPMRLIALADFELANHAGVGEPHAQFARPHTERIFKYAAVDLPRPGRQESAGAQLGDLRQIGLAVGEEKPKAELLQLLRLQQILQPQHFREIMRTDLDARLANLVSGMRDRMGATLDDFNVEFGMFLLELQGQSQAGQATTHDDDVAIQRLGQGLLQDSSQSTLELSQATERNRALCRPIL